jgi:hypothetical protein
MGKKPPPQNGSRLKSVSFLKKSTSFTSSTFPIQPDFSQNQPASITLNTGSPRTLPVRSLRYGSNSLLTYELQVQLGPDNYFVTFEGPLNYHPKKKRLVSSQALPCVNHTLVETP